MTIPMLPPIDALPPEGLVLAPPPGEWISEERLLELSSLFPELRLERLAGGDLLIMAPANIFGSGQNARLTAQLTMWADEEGTGVAFDSSAGFLLPDSAVLSPDCSWVLRSRLQAPPVTDEDGYYPVCPDFVLELRSKSDRLRRLQGKLEQYLQNGCRLGWLMDPSSQQVFVYRPGEPVEVLHAPAEVSGEPVLPGFVLRLQRIWDPGF